MTAPSLAFIVPSYNEGKRLTASLRGLIESSAPRHAGRVDIVVVDDGSTEPAQQWLDGSLAAPLHVHVWCLRHQVNLGQGAALQTAIAFTRAQLKPDVYVTMDADGQHDPGFVPALMEPVVRGTHDIAFGTRFGGEAPVAMPSGRRILLRAATHFERWVTGLSLSDAHNGFRAFNETCAKLIELKQNRMAHATELKQIVARNKLRYTEVPVRVRYTEDSLEKGQRSTGSFLILKDLLKAYLFNG